MSKYLVSIIVVLSLAAGTLYWQLDKTRSEKNRLANNQEALLTDVEFYRTEAGYFAASVQRLELSKSELEKYNDELVSTVKDLNIKIKRIQAASTTATESKYEIETVVKDSIVYRDRPVTLQAINYSDPWITLAGVIDSSLFKGNINTRDTLVQVVHRIPKKFWFIKWGTKAIKQEVVSRNPHSSITYTEYIELKR